MQTQLVAVYGSLRKGFGNHEYFLSNSEFVGDDFTPPTFDMFSLGGFPCITPGSTAITVEVYRVDEETKGNLDSLEGVPHFYHEQKIPTKYGEAGIYVITSPTGMGAKIESGDWKDGYRKRG